MEKINQCNSRRTPTIATIIDSLLFSLEMTIEVASKRHYSWDLLVSFLSTLFCFYIIFFRFTFILFCSLFGIIFCLLCECCFSGWSERPNPLTDHCVCMCRENVAFILLSKNITFLHEKEILSRAKAKKKRLPKNNINSLVRSFLLSFSR